MGAHMIYASLPCKLLNMYALINRTSDLKNASGTSGASNSTAKDKAVTVAKARLPRRLSLSSVVLPVRE